MKMILLSLFILSSCSQVSNQSEATQAKLQAKTYKTQAQALINMAKSEKEIDNLAKKLADLSVSLVEQAKPILTFYKKSHPECGELVDSAISQSNEMMTLNLDQIEERFHAGGSLPKAPESCYDIKELIVHPATVKIISRLTLNEENKEKIVDEIDEVIAHMNDLKL